MYTGTLRKYTLLILCLLCLPTAWAQRRFKVDDKPEYELGKVYGFTFKDVEDDVDAFWGLHASQYAGSHHLMGFSVEGAWTSFVSNWKVPSIRPGGGAAGFHLLYEYQYSGLLVQTGLGINYQVVYTNLRDTGIYHFGMHDKWDGVEPAEFTLKHEFYDRQDRARNLYVQVPLYVAVNTCSVQPASAIGLPVSTSTARSKGTPDRHSTLPPKPCTNPSWAFGMRWIITDIAIMCHSNERENDCVSSSMSWRMWKPDTNIPRSITDVYIVPHRVTASTADFALPDSWTSVCSIYVLVPTKTSMPSPRSPSMTSLPIAWIMSFRQQTHGNIG